MNPIQRTIAYVKQTAGITVTHRNGRWLTPSGIGGAMVPVSPPIALHLSNILQRFQAQTLSRVSLPGGGGVSGAVVGGAIGAGMSPLVGVFGGATVALGGFTAAVVASTRAAQQHAQAVQSLANRSGLSLAQSNRAILSGQAIGVSPENMPQGNAWMRSMLARGIYGGSGDLGPQDIQAFARMYRPLAQRGGPSLMIAQQYARMTGMEGYTDAAMMNPRLLERQLSRSQTMNRSLGMSPGDMRVAQDFGLLTTSLKQLAGLGLSRVGTEIMRHVVGPLDYFVNWATQNGDTIASAIKSGVQTAFDYIRMFARYMYADFPGHIIGATRSVVEFVGNLAAGFEVFRASPLGKLLAGVSGFSVPGAPAVPASPTSPASTATASLASGLAGAAMDNPVGAGALGVGALLMRNPLLRGAGGLLRGGFNLAARGIGGVVGSPIAQMLIRGGGFAIPGIGGLGFPGLARMAPIGLAAGAAYEAGRAVHEFAPLLRGGRPRADRYPHLIEIPGLISNLAGRGASGIIPSAVGGLADMVRSSAESRPSGVTPETLASNPLFNWSRQMLKTLDEKERDLGPADERREEFDKLTNLMDRVARATERTAENTKDNTAGQQILAAFDRFYSYRAGQEATDRYRASFNH